MRDAEQDEEAGPGPRQFAGKDRRPGLGDGDQEPGEELDDEQLGADAEAILEGPDGKILGPARAAKAHHQDARGDDDVGFHQRHDQGRGDQAEGDEQEERGEDQAPG